MTFICPVCSKDCRPLGTNVEGIGIEEFNNETGWKCIGETFKTRCEANAALKNLSNNFKEHRVYSVFKSLATH